MSDEAYPTNGAPFVRSEQEKRDYLAGRPVQCGTALELRMPSDAWLPVRYELDLREMPEPVDPLERGCWTCRQGARRGVWRHKECPPAGTEPGPKVVYRLVATAVLYVSLGHAWERRFTVAKYDNDPEYLRAQGLAGPWCVFDHERRVICTPDAKVEGEGDDRCYPGLEAASFALESAAMTAASDLQFDHAAPPQARIYPPPSALLRWPARQA